LLVRLAQGRFAPRIVSLGSRSDDYVEVLSGVAEGEQVVTAANFLLDAESNLKAALSSMSSAALPAVVAPDSSQAASPQVKTVAVQSKQPPHSVGHLAQGVLDAINADGTVSISHEAIASLGWPAMTMDFALANAALVQAVPIGSRITFELVERKPDDWVITKLQVQRGGH
jgi:Cu(I)/Ag(I) efflux system membrane fusion protein